MRTWIVLAASYFSPAYIRKRTLLHSRNPLHIIHFFSDSPPGSRATDHLLSLSTMTSGPSCILWRSPVNLLPWPKDSYLAINQNCKQLRGKSRSMRGLTTGPHFNTSPPPLLFYFYGFANFVKTVKKETLSVVCWGRMVRVLSPGWTFSVMLLQNREEQQLLWATQ